MYVITANVKKKGQSTSQMTNDKDYHMILVIIIVVRGETMLQRALGMRLGSDDSRRANCRSRVCRSVG